MDRPYAQRSDHWVGGAFAVLPCKFVLFQTWELLGRDFKTRRVWRLFLLGRMELNWRGLRKHESGLFFSCSSFSIFFSSGYIHTHTHTPYAGLPANMRRTRVDTRVNISIPNTKGWLRVEVILVADSSGDFTHLATTTTISGL